MTANSPTISRFTPSLMSHELLERLFVVRERTLDAIMARIDAAATGKGRNHTLLVGPRGAGKTHLVSLVYHRVQERRDTGTRLQVAWLPEDPWTLVSYRHLLTAIARRLDPAVVGEIPRSVGELEALLATRAEADGPIVVVVENLDQILAALKNEGQQRLRHLLQTDRSLLLVATSTRLDRTLSDQSSPFYGFFTTTRLEPFDVDEAGAMLSAIAEEGPDDKLVDYLQSDEGRARLRTISHLAGGQPRMWAALASALSVNGLEELVDLLLTRFDDLTPYYQEQLGRLSGQQRLVVAELAEVDRPVNVGELAERLEIDQRSLSKTMVELVDRGWAAPTSSLVTALLDQRRTYYELAEPLARISFQIKESRGEPLRVVVEFLKHWFDTSDLEESTTAAANTPEYVLLATAGHNQDAVVAVTRRLHRLPATRAPAVALLGEIDDALAALIAGDPEPFLRLPVPVRVASEQRMAEGNVVSVRLEIHDAAHDEFGYVRHPGIERWVTRANDLIANCHDSMKATAQLLSADWLGRAWRFEEAMEVLAAAAAERGPDDLDVLRTRSNLARSLWEAGRAEDALELAQIALDGHVRVLGPDHPRTISTRSMIASSHWRAGRSEHAIEIAEAVVADYERVLGPTHETTLAARTNLVADYWAGGRTKDALGLGQAVLDDQVRVLGPDHPSTLLMCANLAGFHMETGQVDEAIAFAEKALEGFTRLPGANHAGTLAARSVLADSQRQLGHTARALQLTQDVLADAERILGADHPDTLTLRSNLAIFYHDLGRVDEALELLRTVVTDAECVLGTDHPDTIDLRSYLRDLYRTEGRVFEADELESD